MHEQTGNARAIRAGHPNVPRGAAGDISGQSVQEVVGVEPFGLVIYAAGFVHGGLRGRLQIPHMQLPMRAGGAGDARFKRDLPAIGREGGAFHARPEHAQLPVCQGAGDQIIYAAGGKGGIKMVVIAVKCDAPEIEVRVMERLTVLYDGEIFQVIGQRFAADEIKDGRPRGKADPAVPVPSDENSGGRKPAVRRNPGAAGFPGQLENMDRLEIGVETDRLKNGESLANRLQTQTGTAIAIDSFARQPSGEAKSVRVVEPGERKLAVRRAQRRVAKHQSGPPPEVGELVGTGGPGRSGGSRALPALVLVMDRERHNAGDNHDAQQAEQN